jgi:murein DD-endopeptidase MepM/ murein hydrolase activator NlpD
MRSRGGRWAALGLILLALALVQPSDAQPARAKTTKTAKTARTPAKPGGSPPVAAPTPGLGHVVRPGQTLWSVAREHGVSVDALIRANRLTPTTRLRAGQRLSLPLSEVVEGSQEPPSFADIVLEPPPQTPLVHFIRPVPGPVASPFGPRRATWHGGVDLRAERGSPVLAAAAGMVISSGWERAYGRVVKIWHQRDLMTVYAHNHENLVKVGDWVEQGQVIATVGSTGRATAPHLHFEIRLEGHKYNPEFWLPEGEILSASAEDPRRPATVP